MTVEILSTVVNCMPTKNPVCKDLLEGVTQTLRNRGYIYVYFTTKVVQSQLQIKNIKVTGQGQEVCTRT